MDADALVTGDYIKAAEFGTTFPTNPTWRIKSVDIVRMPDLKRPGKEKDKGVVYFHDIERGWVMNRTNVECLKAMFGRDTDAWPGRRITLGTEPTKTGPGVRVIGSPEIDRDVIAEWTPSRQKKITKKMVPTGTPNQRQPAKPQRTEHDNFLDAVNNELGLDRADVAAFLAGQGITVTDRPTGEAVWNRMLPGGDLRTAFDKGPEVES